MMKKSPEENELTAEQDLSSADLLSLLVLEHGGDFVDARPQDDYVVWLVLQEYLPDDDPGEYRTVHAIWAGGFWWEIDGEEEVYGDDDDDSDSWLPVRKLDVGISRKMWHAYGYDNGGS
jgi:hypothetical protein